MNGDPSSYILPSLSLSDSVSLLGHNLQIASRKSMKTPPLAGEQTLKAPQSSCWGAQVSRLFLSLSRNVSSTRQTMWLPHGPERGPRGHAVTYPSQRHPKVLT